MVAVLVEPGMHDPLLVVKSPAAIDPWGIKRRRRRVNRDRWRSATENCRRESRRRREGRRLHWSLASFAEEVRPRIGSVSHRVDGRKLGLCRGGGCTGTVVQSLKLGNRDTKGCEVLRRLLVHEVARALEDLDASCGDGLLRL